ncbi:TIGR02594 family protein [Sphingomonas sp. MG17]|uniref:TIGR02594 family protein n=1 Tax=Sphingomonas tagetis TaxID=2949092 RepID=A0A9X2HIW0_9SPHN|nr:TIGR02594 family protein [Sphingomonas tagetis]MCP3730447.1 TIGR02594 family protein [Sphingomonas tagetis]
MGAFNHAAFMREWRHRQGVIPAPLYRDVMAALEVGFGTALPTSASAHPSDPPWLVEARKDIGLKETPGKAHTPRILQMLAFVSYPFSDDETPWCGTAMAAWMKQAGIVPPKQGFRAASWTDWGVACAAQLGAIGVKKRPGGNHVFQIVGETADKRFFKALGANQKDMVNIMDVAKADVDAIRWPAGIPERNIPLPGMPKGVISKDEA